MMKTKRSRKSYFFIDGTLYIWREKRAPCPNTWELNKPCLLSFFSVSLMLALPASIEKMGPVFPKRPQRVGVR